MLAAVSSSQFFCEERMQYMLVFWGISTENTQGFQRYSNFLLKKVLHISNEFSEPHKWMKKYVILRRFFVDCKISEETVCGSRVNG